MKNQDLSLFSANSIDRLTKKKEIVPISVYSAKRNTYPELQLFKNQIDFKNNHIFLKPYTSEKRKVSFYRTIFLSLGILYLILAFILFSKPLTWTCSVIFGSSIAVKTVLCTACILASAYCLLQSWKIKPEKEAIKKIFASSKMRLKMAYQKKVADCDLHPFFAQGEDYKKSVGLKQTYHESIDRLQKFHEETLHILERIHASAFLEAEKKEELFNQAILEGKDKMEYVVKTFNP